MGFWCIRIARYVKVAEDRYRFVGQEAPVCRVSVRLPLCYPTQHHEAEGKVSGRSSSHVGIACPLQQEARLPQPGLPQSLTGRMEPQPPNLSFRQP